MSASHLILALLFFSISVPVQAFDLAHRFALDINSAIGHGFDSNEAGDYVNRTTAMRAGVRSVLGARALLHLPASDVVASGRMRADAVTPSGPCTRANRETVVIVSSGVL
ncbi:hypothetical protein EVAR_19994_1 [Eumeta japonica]|uniref:Uncharacterized protein n=1 Tax=Eumeta variegata TaxID=151549 RepID=A0A4C1VC05_EUMVA|nr:hypothetical protein EVAR_19994_1 [Eumeta japonica]